MKLDDIVSKPSVEAAPLLLGWIVCRELPGGVVKLKIVETEAYHQDDPASHSFAGPTKRTAPMFESGGRLYIYFSYGMHYALNIVTGPAGVGEAVLIRAGQPLEGIDIMKKNRYGAKFPHLDAAQGSNNVVRNLANGPGKLAQAIGIKGTSLSGKILNKSSINASKNITSGDPDIWLEPPVDVIGPYLTSARIGISKATSQPWRFYLEGSDFVSKKR